MLFRAVLQLLNVRKIRLSVPGDGFDRLPQPILDSIAYHVGQQVHIGGSTPTAVLRSIQRARRFSASAGRPASNDSAIRRMRNVMAESLGARMGIIDRSGSHATTRADIVHVDAVSNVGVAGRASREGNEVVADLYEHLLDASAASFVQTVIACDDQAAEGVVSLLGDIPTRSAPLTLMLRRADLASFSVATSDGERGATPLHVTLLVRYAQDATVEDDETEGSDGGADVDGVHIGPGGCTVPVVSLVTPMPLPAQRVLLGRFDQLVDLRLTKTSWSALVALVASFASAPACSLRTVDAVIESLTTVAFPIPPPTCRVVNIDLRSIEAPTSEDRRAVRLIGSELASALTSITRWHARGVLARPLANAVQPQSSKVVVSRE